MQWATIASFQILSNSIFITYYTARRHAICYAGSVLKRTTKQLIATNISTY
jgi:hypothetical protein